MVDPNVAHGASARKVSTPRGKEILLIGKPSGGSGLKGDDRPLQTGDDRRGGCHLSCRNDLEQPTQTLGGRGEVRSRQRFARHPLSAFPLAGGIDPSLSHEPNPGRASSMHSTHTAAYYRPRLTALAVAPCRSTLDSGSLRSHDPISRAQESGAVSWGWVSAARLYGVRDALPASGISHADAGGRSLRQVVRR